MSHSATVPTTGTIAAAAAGLVKVYGTGDTAVRAVDGIDITFEKGTFTAVMGPSGSGKSTLMHCLAGLDAVSAGSIRIGDAELSGLSDDDLTRVRRDRIGFIFQSFNLLPTLTARDNILLPQDLAGRTVEPRRLADLARSLGISDRLDHVPSELSGGQQQRVAVARALLGRPEVVFADEPTGALDSRTGAALLAYLRLCVREAGQTVVMVTHDPVAASYADRVVMLADGRIVGEIASPTVDSVIAALASAESR